MSIDGNKRMTTAAASSPVVSGMETASVQSVVDPHVFAVDDDEKLNDIANNIKKHEIAVAVSFIEIGKLLNEAKSRVDHGNWIYWLKTNTNISYETATRFMSLAKEFPKMPPVQHLGFSKALLLMKIPAEERQLFFEKEHTVAIGLDEDVISFTSHCPMCICTPNQ